MTAAVSEIDDRPEGHREHDERDPDDVEEEQRQPLVDPVGDVLERRVEARHVRHRLAALGRRRDDVRAQPVDELLGLLVLRRRVGGHEDDRDGLRVVELRLAGRRDALEVCAVVDPLRRPSSPFTSTTIGIGPLKPGPKPSARRSYARRAVCSVGCVPWSEAPSRTSADVDGEQEAQHEQDDEHRLVRAPSPIGPSAR